jgi:hypothetical protein
MYQDEHGRGDVEAGASPPVLEPEPVVSMPPTLDHRDALIKVQAALIELLQDRGRELTPQVTQMNPARR